MDLTAKKKAADKILSILSSIPDEKFTNRIRKAVELSVRRASEPTKKKRGRSIFVENEKNYHIEAMRNSGKSFRETGKAFGLSGARAKGICDKLRRFETSDFGYERSMREPARKMRSKLFGFETYPK